jgi:sugar phosphate isomerase/epimerase
MVKREKFCGIIGIVLFATLAGRTFAQTTQPTVKEHIDHTALTKLTWQMACRVECFQPMNVLDVINILHPLNVHHLELTPHQRTSDKAGTGGDALSAKLQSDHMDVVSYDMPKELADDPFLVKTLPEIAQKLKAKNIVTDAPAESLASLDARAQELGINIAILNDGPGGQWTDPDVLAKALVGRSNRMGICADIANWRRCGYSPADCIQKFPGRVFEVRLSDVNSAGQEVVLGTGDAQAEQVLTWLKHHDFKGVCSIGYSSGEMGAARFDNWIKSANAFSDIVVKLAAEK